MGPTIDPVTQAHEYQQMLLSYLGTDDPYDAQAGTPQTAPIPRRGGGRSPADAAGSQRVVRDRADRPHRDAELGRAGRYRWILSQDGPPLIGYDQDLWTARLGHQKADPADLLDLFDAVRRSNLALWKGTAEADRARVGLHSERGPESYELSFRLIAGHDRFHIEQARRTLEDVRNR